MKKILTNLFVLFVILYLGWKNIGFDADHFQSSSQILIYGIWGVVALYFAYQVIVDILKEIKK